MAFALREDYYNVQTKLGLLDNTITVKVGDVITPLGSTDNVYTNATAQVSGDKYVLGVVIGFAYANGQVVGQGQDPTNTPNQVTTTSTNTTVAKVYAVYVPIYAHMVWSATLSAAAGTTTHSDAEFVCFPLKDARTLDEASVVVVTSGPLQFLSYGKDPADSNNLTVIGKFQKALMTQP